MRSTPSSYYIMLTVAMVLFMFLPVKAFPQALPSEVSEQNDEPAQSSNIYIDQVIDESQLVEDIEKKEKAILPELGPGMFGLTYRFYNNDLDETADLTEHGLELRWRQETFENGSYEIQADGITTEGYEGQDPSGGRILIRQRNYTLNQRFQLDSDVINYRSINPKLVTESYRLRLPSTILQGMGNVVHSNNTSLYLNFGKIGRYVGTAARAYDPTKGSMQGIGAEHRLNNNWDLGFQFWNTTETELFDTHQSFAGAIQHHRLSQNHQLHFLGDSQGKIGSWYDGAMEFNRWSHRAGIAYLPPDLLWTDAPISNDRAGLYWRGDRKSFKWLWNLGAEISKNNLDNDQNAAGYITSSTFANVSWQFRRNSQLGANLNFQNDYADSGSADEDKYRTTLKGFLVQRFPIGRTRLQPLIESWQSSSEDYLRYGILWDQDWYVRFCNRLDTDVEYFQMKNGDDEFNFRLYLEKNFLNDLRLTGSAQHNVYRTGFGDDHTSSFSVGMGWQFIRNWMVSLNADYNTNMFDPDVEGGSESSVDGTRVLVSFSYAFNTGKQRSLYGVDTGNPGRGRIVGIVFLDENKNGKLDLGEKTLRDIVVNLDGMFSTESGPNGGFEFWPVASGEHHLTLSMDNVPLPWGLKDESPVRVVVPIRKEAQVDFALSRLNE